MRFGRIARRLAYAALALGTVGYAVHAFATGDTQEAMAFWRGQLILVPLLLLIACVDIALECVSWMWVYSRFGIRSWNRDGLYSCVATRAGLLLPAQLNRLIRPECMTRLGRASSRDALMAEGATFVLDATSALALLVGVTAFLVHPALGIAASLVTIGVVLFFGDTVADKLSDTKLATPRGFWRSRASWATIMLQMGGWVAFGLGLWLILRNVPPSLPLSETVLYATLASVIGAGTGIPGGGLGVMESALGISLRLRSVDPEHLVIVVLSFRLLTFWVWIPVGWVALMLVNRRVASRGAAPLTGAPDPDAGAPATAMPAPEPQARRAERDSGMMRGSSE